MVTSVEELLVARTADEIVTEQLAVLTTEDFPVTSWVTDGAARNMVLADSTALAALDAKVADLAKAAFLDDATGDWLTLRAYAFFQVTRTPADYTEGYVRVTVAAGAGPYSIGAAALLVTDGVRRWRSLNTAAVTVTSSTPVDFLVRAESAGTAFNVAAGTITQVVSPANAGMSVSNPVYASGTWVTTAGAALETDASVRARCRAKWGTLGRGANDAAYVYWARTGHSAEAQVTRAKVVWGPGDGTLTLYLAGPDGPVSPTVENIVGAWVESNQPGTDFPTIVSASAAAVTLLASVTVRAANDSTANRALATDALAAYIAGLDIGDDVDLGALYHAIYQATGLIDVDITQPATDTSVNNGQVATISVSITWTVV